MVASLLRGTVHNVSCFLCIFMASIFIAQATTTEADFHFSFVLFLSVLCLLYLVMLDNIATSIDMTVADAMTKIKHESEKTATKIAASAASVDNAIAKLLLSTLA